MIIERNKIQNSSDILDILLNFISLFKVICDKSYNKNSANEKHISSVLRGSFSEEFLKKTTLYRKVSDYFNNIKVWCCWFDFTL